MSDQPIEQVVFDIGNVLVLWDPRNLYRKLFAGDEAAMERFLAEVCTPAWNHQLDLGRPWREMVDELAARFPGQRSLIEAYHLRWQEMVAGPVPGTAALLARLKARAIPLYGLTNFSSEKFAETRDRFPEIGHLQGIVVSAEEGLAKPDPRIFEVLTTRFCLEPSRTLFIDDNADNIATAHDLAFITHHFSASSGLALHLEQLGVLERDGRGA